MHLKVRGLPDSYGTLVTALEAREKVPKMEIVTERFERKQREHSDYSEEKAMATRQYYSRKGSKCESLIISKGSVEVFLKKGRV